MAISINTNTLNIARRTPSDVAQFASLAHDPLERANLYAVAASSETEPEKRLAWTEEIAKSPYIASNSYNAGSYNAGGPWGGYAPYGYGYAPYGETYAYGGGPGYGWGGGPWGGGPGYGYGGYPGYGYGGLSGMSNSMSGGGGYGGYGGGGGMPAMGRSMFGGGGGGW